MRKEVIILFGSKGSGKSTFLKRLFYHKPPQYIKDFAMPIIVDLIRSPQDKQKLSTEIWAKLIKQLDLDHVLEGDINQLTELFHEKFEIARKQELFNLPPEGTEYTTTLRDLVVKWKADTELCAKSLKTYWLRKSRSIVVVLDNTDQLPPDLQDFCFLEAQEISEKLDCLTIISMREERYCRAKIHGVLDAYHNNGYHLSAPKADLVFIKRINYILTILNRYDFENDPLNISKTAPLTKIIQFLRVILKECKRQESHLKDFLITCSHGNIRLALEFLRQYITSGYTNVKEMIESRAWNVHVHQVLKPMMVPERHNYDEVKSKIPNLYQVRSNINGSHFTGLRVLHALAQVSSGSTTDSFIGVPDLITQFDNQFDMREDCEMHLDIFLSHGIVEANNRMDELKQERSISTSGDMIREFVTADMVRITPFGRFLLLKVAKQFTYLDLISLDCGLRSESLYHHFVKLANRERQYASRGKRIQKISSRLDRVEAFIDYLVEEESEEVREYSLSTSDVRFVDGIKASFKSERIRVISSAKRNVKPHDRYFV